MIATLLKFTKGIYYYYKKHISSDKVERILGGPFESEGLV